MGNAILSFGALTLATVEFYSSLRRTDSYLAGVAVEEDARKLVELLGYTPRPAVAGSGRVAAVGQSAERTGNVGGEGLRVAGSADGEVQVYEAGVDVVRLDPSLSAFTLEPQRPPEVGEQLLFAADDLSAGSDTTIAVVWTESATNNALNARYRQRLGLPLASSGVLLPRSGFDGVFGNSGAGFQAASEQTIEVGGARTLTELVAVAGTDGETYFRPELDRGIAPPTTTSTDSVKVLSFALTARVSIFPTADGTPLVDDREVAGVRRTDLILDALYPQIAEDDLVVVGRGATSVLTRVVGVGSGAVLLRDAIPPDSPAVTTRVTGIAVSPALPVEFLDAPTEQLRVLFSPVSVAKATRVSADRIESAEATGLPIQLEGATPPDQELDHSGDFLIRDAVGKGALINGRITAGVSRTLTLDVNEVISGPDELRLPATIYGNVLPISRGETVTDEVLGSGNATQTFQEFTFAKSPLTFFADSKAPRGFRSTLTVRVNGIEWTEVASFFGVGPEERVYIVRPTEDEGEFKVVFGDGVRGQRPSSGVDNITATYRFGAGKDAPPPGAINQIVSPAPGIESVINVFAPTGGADADGPEEIRRAAPRSALTLGRAVSLADFEALALEFGVTNAMATWAWDTRSQNAVVKVWFIGEVGPDLGEKLRVYLQGFADPTTPIQTARAVDTGQRVAIDLEVDPAFRSDDVERAVLEALLDDDCGIFALSQVPIGRPIFRSEIFKQICSVGGVLSVRAMTLQGVNFPFALNPGEGRFVGAGGRLFVGNTAAGDVLPPSSNVFSDLPLSAGPGPVIPDPLDPTPMI